MSMKSDDQEEVFQDPCAFQSSKRRAQHSWQQTKEDNLHDRIELNIGGQRFETTKDTLCKGSEMLAAWLNRFYSSNGVIWIDRDGDRFAHILNYLRNGTVWLDDVPSLRGLQEEALYFGIASLQRQCEEMIQAIEAKEEEKASKRSHELRSALREVLENANFTVTCPQKGKVLALTRGTPLTWTHEHVFQTDLDF
ncbi:hypothetical protein CY35_07G120000 [Sphagnum magellanicum]|jgi:hypothetical protein|uniref:Uncharacterized protein n=1 Tax=Sphagnum magellanicum TaxID=128215 RepID=A0ACB8HPG8_9BRYO|nr:hypothetical protein CY35_07G120000 [Sphagnum magellanicum]